MVFEERVEEPADLEGAVEGGVVEQAQLGEIRLSGALRSLTRVDRPGVVLGVAVVVRECVKESWDGVMEVHRKQLSDSLSETRTVSQWTAVQAW